VGAKVMARGRSLPSGSSALQEIGELHHRLLLDLGRLMIQSAIRENFDNQSGSLLARQHAVRVAENRHQMVRAGTADVIGPTIIGSFSRSASGTR
jgi:hypothetical protein